MPQTQSRKSDVKFFFRSSAEVQPNSSHVAEPNVRPNFSVCRPSVHLYCMKKGKN